MEREKCIMEVFFMLLVFVVGILLGHSLWQPQKAYGEVCINPSISDQPHMLPNDDQLPHVNLMNPTETCEAVTNDLVNHMVHHCLEWCDANSANGSDVIVFDHVI